GAEKNAARQAAAASERKMAEQAAREGICFVAGTPVIVDGEEMDFVAEEFAGPPPGQGEWVAMVVLLAVGLAGWHYLEAGRPRKRKRGRQASAEADARFDGQGDADPAEDGEGGGGTPGPVPDCRP